MTALEIVQAVAGELGITVPNAAAGSADLQVSQLLSLLNASGRALAKRHDWQVLIKEQTFPSVAAESQGALTDLIDEPFYKIVNKTIWNRTTTQMYCGPKSAEGFQAYKANGGISVFGQYRIRQGNLYLLPAPTAGHTFAFEYKSKYWAASEAGEGKKAFTADNDEPLLDEDLLILDLKWRWKAAKGQDYAESFNEAEAAIVDAMGPDGTSASVELSGADPVRTPGVVVRPGSWSLS